MNTSQYMDKQIMDLSNSQRSNDFIDLKNPQEDDHIGGGDGGGVKKEEILPSYDFQPIRHLGIPLTSGIDSSNIGGARVWTSADSKINSSIRNYGSLGSIEPGKLILEKDRNVYDEALVSEIDRTMKKHADNLLHALDGVSARLSQLETRTRHIENSVDDLKLSVGNNQGNTDGKLRQLEVILREVQTDVEVVKDKQEIMEAQLNLSKLQIPKVDHQPETQNTAHVDSPQQQYAAPPAASAPLQSHHHPHHQQLPPAAPIQPPQHPTYAPPNAPPPPPPSLQNPPPSLHQLPPNQIPQRDPYYSPPQQTPEAPNQQYQAPPLPQPQTPPPPQQQYPPTSYPQYSQPPPPQPQPPLPPQPEETPYLKNQSYRQPHSQPPPSGAPPSQQFYGPPPPMYEPPPPTRSGSGFSSGYGSGEQFTYGGPQSQYGSGSPRKSQQLAPPSVGQSGGSGYPQLPTARILPHAIPTASGVGGGAGGGSGSSGTGNRVPIDDVVDRVTNMGFPRDQVRATVRTLTENGQSVDLNVVLDKLMNDGGEGSNNPQRGWFGR